MEFKHFSHEHPLIFNELEKKRDDGEKLVRHCNGCLEKIVPGPSYCCSKSCDFWLHKLCAELPREMEHNMHPEHSVTLLALRDCRCDVCGEWWSNFTYNCSLCDFDVDIICASLMERRIEHESHKHPLNRLRSPAVHFCRACGTKHEGIFYFCITCSGQFWINSNCASLPSTIKHSDHDHPLTLGFSLPRGYSKFWSGCDICGKYLSRTCWFYYCGECKYLAHVNCATSKIEPFMSILLPDRKTVTVNEDLDLALIHLPVLDEYASPVSHFFKTNQNENNRAKKLAHFSHEHQLILFYAQNNNESCAESKPSLPSEKENEKFCNACIQPIFTEFYSCPQCNFLLHKWCAELPTEVHDHPCHPQHTLILLPKSEESVGLFECQCCESHYNGFRYGCVSCKFYLDVNCASIPGAIIHEAHAHHQLIFKRCVSDTCNACHGWRYDHWGFKCDTCDFELHLECALLPKKVSHRYEKHHPLTLTYYPVNDGSDEFFCEICENDLNPKNWFYHSGDCDCNQWFHAECIHPERGTIKLDDHPHILSYVPCYYWHYIDISCDYCGKGITGDNLSDDFAVKCHQCKYLLHVRCALLK